MSQIKRPENKHAAYHAHVYFDEDSKEVARALCAEVANRFKLKVGRFNEKLVGPHPMWSFQVIFAENHFDDFIPWLDQNRQGLTVLVHALTGDDLTDHTEYAYWLGRSVDLNLDIFVNQT